MLRRLSPDDPPAILEQVVAGEQVHAVAGDEDLRRRLAPDRRIYALADDADPDRLLAFVEVALVQGLAGSIPSILRDPVDRSAEASADTAVFYSINSCVPPEGPKGVGKALLELVVPELAARLPALRTFATLSPLPGFRAWLTAADAALAARLPAPDADPGALPAAGDPLAAATLAAAARYVSSVDERGRLADPVGNFHVGNGAAVARLWWAGDPSPAGLARSWGVMVSYRYEPDRLAERSDAYRSRGEVTVDEPVQALLA